MSDNELTAIENRVIELTNAERRKNGLSELKRDKQLSKVARTRTNDMQKNEDLSSGPIFEMINNAGISYSSAAVNLGKGPDSAKGVVEFWLNSDNQRKNMLNKDATHVGVGYNQYGHYWTLVIIR
ncbi:CAP domain-containing protein [Evansella sp. AB-P1]|uniref:CAP domain-containing protein n=1 Tax=Evansella sp. AB-P1 TaxID=3037653 RepID=UPI00241C0CB8|nr:CAP domain-containing protein [Evansella sp. AB-P1]MDG5789852.1 CAP domain-containing protein [Evansella sp. AB-P1]